MKAEPCAAFFFTKNTHDVSMYIYIYMEREREREVMTHDVSIYIYRERESARERELRGPESRVWRSIKPAQRQAARLRASAQGDQRKRRRRTCRLVAPRRPE